MKHVSQFIPSFLKELEEKIKSDDNQERRENSLKKLDEIRKDLASREAQSKV